MPDFSLLVWIAFSFLCGSLPFSVWLTGLLGKDPRTVGDHNPGATNAMRSGGKWVGLAVLLLDISKAAVPVGLAAQVFHIQGWGLAAIAFAPSLGHAYSPFLGFQGGKAIASVLGVWIGLTIWDMPLVSLAALTASYLVLKNAGRAVACALLVMAAYLWFARPVPAFFLVLALQTILLLWKHRSDLWKPHD